MIKLNYSSLGRKFFACHALPGLVLTAKASTCDTDHSSIDSLGHSSGARWQDSFEGKRNCFTKSETVRLPATDKKSKVRVGTCRLILGTRQERYSWQKCVQAPTHSRLSTKLLLTPSTAAAPRLLHRLLKRPFRWVSCGAHDAQPRTSARLPATGGLARVALHVRLYVEPREPLKHTIVYKNRRPPKIPPANSRIPFS